LIWGLRFIDTLSVNFDFGNFLDIELILFAALTIDVGFAMNDALENNRRTPLHLVKKIRPCCYNEGQRSKISGVYRNLIAMQIPLKYLHPPPVNVKKWEE
jgi:hypothetical protein